MNYAKHVAESNIPQSEAASPKQSQNNAGGYSFTLDIWKRLDRFLILGSEGGTYYVKERKLTQDNAKNVLACIEADPKRTVDTIVAVSDQGRAPKNDPALFALALVCKKAKEASARRYAYEALPKVARIGTHLFHFAESIKHLGGWGRATQRAFGNWYLQQDPNDLIYQVIKYASRDGWSHRDILRKVHPKTDDATRQVIFAYITGKTKEDTKFEGVLERFAVVEEVKTLKEQKNCKRLCQLIEAHDLPREVLPTEALNFPEVWTTLLARMPVTAMIRNLGKMTSMGVLKQLSDEAKHVRATLTNEKALKAARVHPLNILVALKTYAQGHGEKGKLTWTANPKILDALNEAFYLAFQAIEPTGKRYLLGVDVSGSMSSPIAGMAISCAEAAGALAMVTMAREPECAVMGFCHTLTHLDISPTCRLDDIAEKMFRSNFGGTDCAQPILYAMENRIPVDVFQIYTDNQTWAGKIHPHVALKQYQQKMGIAAKEVVLGMTASEFTIADPEASNQLDVVGFDTSVPSIISDFARE